MARLPFVVVTPGVTLAIGLLVPGIAQAHPGHSELLSSSGWLAGAAHPLTGLDHLLAMLALGLWLALNKVSLRQKAAAIGIFLAAMLSGSLLGLAGLHSPAIEPLILLSLLVFGLLAGTASRLPFWAIGSLSAFFAVFHGLAHGLETPLAVNPVAYIAGFLGGTLALLVAGTALGLALRGPAVWLARVAATGIAAYGLSLLSLS